MWVAIEVAVHAVLEVLTRAFWRLFGHEEQD